MSTSWTPDFVVVGAGVIGSSIAYHLARAGGAVLLADPGAPRPPSASWASAGGVRRQNRDPREWALTTAAWHRWPLLERELGEECGFRDGGHLHVAEDESALDRIRSRAADQRAANLDVELLDRDAVREIAPLLSDAVAGGTYTRGDGHADPRLTTRAFQRAAVRHGARIRNEPIGGFATDAGRVVGVAFGPQVVRTGQTVLAAGSWSASLALPLGLTLPVRPQGLQMLLTDPHQPVLAPTLTAEGVPVSFKQLATGAFLIGGGWPADVDPGGIGCTVRSESVEGSWATAGDSWKP
jgi:sarcosine oxidase subunit beta